jgi:hypothetical protein
MTPPDNSNKKPSAMPDRSQTHLVLIASYDTGWANRCSTRPPPRLRVVGRRISNWWANLETLWAGIGDSLFGMRVYPAGLLLRVMQANRWMRRFDFDVEAASRISTTFATTRC